MFKELGGVNGISILYFVISFGASSEKRWCMKDEQLKLKVICTELPGTRFEDPYGFALRRGILILPG